MTKQEEFLWLVQTTMLINSLNLATDPELRERYREEFTTTGVAGIAGDAIDASKRIPDDMSARDAAADFCDYMLQNLRDIENKAHGDEMQVPYWFAQH